MRLPLSVASLVAFLCLHQPALALSPPAHVAAVAEPGALQPQAFQSVVTHSASTSPNSPSDIEWLLILSVVLTSGVISWGIRQYVKQQTWQRIEFLRQAVKEFEHAPEVHNALKILDFEEYRDYQIPAGSEGKTVSFRVDDELLCNALATHDQRARQKQQLNDSEDRDQLDPEALRQYQIETALRDWFNAMLNGLEHFGYFIESGMFSEKELRPWLNYWIKLIAEPAYRRPGASRFYDALYSYIHNSGFFGVQKLFDRFGYRILPSPYQDTDLANIALSTSSYDSRLALTLAKASYLAYQDKQFVAQIVGRWGAAFEADRDRHHHRDEPLTQQPVTPRVRRTKNNFIRHNFRYFNNRGRDTQAYMFRTDEFVVLAFRGSQEPQDWLTNFTTQLRNFTIRKDGVTGISSYKGRVHTGFFLAWAIIEKSVLSQIHRWRHEMVEDGKRFPPLYITGHSLGGALATMAAAALIDNGISVAGVYTFGQPRVGDRTFVKQLNLNTGGKVFRFVNNNDIVPHVPPPFSIWNPMRLYTHVGTAKYFNAKGIMMANYKLTSRLFDGGFGLVRGIFGAGFDLITDHNMEYYISHLNDALQEELEDKAAQMLEVGKQ